MHFILNSLFLGAGIIWGDWKNWWKYHSTILFLWFGDLLYNFLCYDLKMWKYKESIFAESLLSNHTVISLLIMFVTYPATVLIYLGKFPKKHFNSFIWVIFWVTIYSVIEYINVQYLDLVSHHNGWSMGWSILFNSIMFPMLRLHYKKPIIALLTSIPIILFFVLYFSVPIGK
ncbi:CBO0543 family protein [Gracilibacillus sp. YIM 98692]|uniref:CBO0543 family protein n=1 Tax=Gracilibacillus sp. YIM 98692 TaxID=2663532 RepID=UPI001969E0B9|nr:CBO0543 family protein [Gracilibacillus sp. YIM 98692]